MDRTASKVPPTRSAEKLETLAGQTFDHEENRAEGVSRRAGKTQNLYGWAKDNLRHAGDQAERAAGETGYLAKM